MSPKAQNAFKRGMKKKELEKGAGINEDTVWIPKGDTVPLQFYTDPDDFITFPEHQWEEERGKWYFVPCTGDDCVLCDDESDDRNRTSYQFAAQVYNLKDKKPQVLKGGKDLGGRIYYRYERKPNSFTKRGLEVTKFATRPVSFEVAPADDKPLDLSKVKPIDLDDWWQKQVKAYYGDNIPKASDMEDDDPPEDEDEEWEDEEPEDEDESSEETEEEEEEEEPEPEPKRKPKAKAKAGKSKPKR